MAWLKFAEKVAPPPQWTHLFVFTRRGTGRRGCPLSYTSLFPYLAISTSFPQPGALQMCSAVGPLAEDPGNCRPDGDNRSLATCKMECLSCSGAEPTLAGKVMSCPVLPPRALFPPAGEQSSLHPLPWKDVPGSPEIWPAEAGGSMWNQAKGRGLTRAPRPWCTKVHRFFLLLQPSVSAPPGFSLRRRMRPCRLLSGQC